MPAAMGTAVHNSVEDLCNLDLSDKEDSEDGRLPCLNGQTFQNVLLFLLESVRILL